MNKVKLLSLLLIALWVCPPKGSALAPFSETSENNSYSDESGADWLKRKVAQLRLMRVDFYDHGKAVTNYDQFAIDAALSFGEFLIEDDLFQDPPPRFGSVKHALIPQEESFEPFFRSLVFQGWYGRTLVFYDHDKGNYKAFKFLTEFEEPGKLVYESEWFEFIQKYKDQMGLKGTYPRPWLLNGERVLRFKSVPGALFSFFKSAMDKTNETIHIDSSKTNDGLGHTVMAYEVDSLDYFRYLNDSDVTETEFNQGLDLLVHDTLALAKHGILHTALISSMHDSPRGRRFDGGRHLWMIDVINKMEERPGVGRLHAWLNALKYSNVRLSGLADFAELAFLDDMAWPNYVPSRHFEINLMRFEMEDRRKLIWMSHLGDLLLVHTLFIGERWRQKNQWDWEKNETLAPLAEELKNFFLTFSSQLNFDSTQLDFLINQVDWLRLSRQMALFMAEGDRYLAFLEEGRESSDVNFSESVFGKKVRVDLSKDMTQARGYIQTDVKTGLYWSAFDRGFLEKVLSRLSVKYKIKQGPDFVGWTKLIRPYDNQSIIPLLKSLKEENEAMYLEFLELLSPDLGPVNGPFPIQELVRAMYIFTTAAILKEPQQEDLYPVDLFQHLRPDIGSVIGSGHGAILNGVVDTRTGEFQKKIGVLRFKDEYDSPETIETYKLAKAVFDSKPNLKDHVMNVLDIDEEKRFVYVELIDVSWGESQRKPVGYPTSLQDFLANKPTEDELIEVVSQLLTILLELRKNNPNNKAYDLNDLNTKNFLLVRDNNKWIVKRIDLADFGEVAAESGRPFEDIAIFLQQLVFPKFMYLLKQANTAIDFNDFLSLALNLEKQMTFSYKKVHILELIYNLVKEKDFRQKELAIELVILVLKAKTPYFKPDSIKTSL